MAEPAHPARQANGKAVRSVQRKPKHNVVSEQHKAGTVHLAKHHLKHVATSGAINRG